MVPVAVLSYSLDVIKMAPCKQGAIDFNSWVLMATLGKQQSCAWVPPNSKPEVFVGLVASVMEPGGQWVWDPVHTWGDQVESSRNCMTGQ